jgi:large subunit ribosomal protein L25
MLSLPVKIRKILGKKVKALRKKGILPAVLYGPKIKTPLPLEVDFKKFEKTYKEAGESSLVSLEVDGKKSLVLIHEVKLDPLTENPIHVDFYQPRLEEEVEATVPLVFEGEAAAVKDLGGTLVKNISEVEVKAKPQNLPHEIKVTIDRLKTFEDNILIKDLVVSKDVKILKAPEEIVAAVSPPEKVEEELEKPIEEKVEEVEKVEEKGEEKEKEKEKEKEEPKPPSTSPKGTPEPK